MNHLTSTLTKGGSSSRALWKHSVTGRSHGVQQRQQHRLVLESNLKKTTHSRKKNFSTKDGKSEASGLTPEQQAYTDYMSDANNKMKTYHDARIAALRGELPKRNKMRHDTNYLQGAVVVIFMALFGASPFLGKKIAEDAEFRKKYIPEWYDFTVKKPTSELTREQVHEQVLQLQKEIRARAIRGDFAPEKVEKMREYVEGKDRSNKEHDPENDPHAWAKANNWDRIHPGMSEDDYDEDNE